MKSCRWPKRAGLANLKGSPLARMRLPETAAVRYPNRSGGTVGMILEGIVTTRSPDGTVNVAPMGPQVDSSMRRLVLRPFQTSQTYQNLKRHGEGVLHVVDDVWLLARAAIGTLDPPPPMVRAHVVDGYVLEEACRWYEFRVGRIDDTSERTTIEAEVVAEGRWRDFFGFNRAKHAVVEAAILATRVHILPREQILEEFQRLAVLVEKTGGEQEHRAFRLLEEYVRSPPSDQEIV